MKRRFIAGVLFTILLFSSLSAMAAWVSYPGRTLPKIYVPTDPNVYLQTTGTKISSTQSGRHNLQSVVTSSNSQAVRMWRSDGVSVTGVLWHSAGGTYNMGVGSSAMLTGYTYVVRARGNTDNTSSVVVTGRVDADGGAPI